MSVAVNILLFAGLMFQPPKDFPDLSLKCGVLANAKAQPVEMPRATAFLVSDRYGYRLEDRFDVFDLWRSESIRGRWCDQDGSSFSISMISRKLTDAVSGETRMRRDWHSLKEGSLLKAKDLDALDEAVYMLSPVDVGERVKPRRSQRQNLAELWRYSTTNENAFVYAFRPRVERKGRSCWYLASLISEDMDAAEKIDRWLDDVEWIKPKSAKQDSGDSEKMETELLAQDYRRNVVNYSDWHFTSASNVVIVDNMADASRMHFISSLTNGLPLMQAAYRKLLPSPLMDDSHIAAVRIFDTREEYLAYVGIDMKWSAALWSPQQRELVLYSPERGTEALLRTVWHEALHQYLDYACSMVQSPAWFNEGHAVLFEHSHFNMDGEIVFDAVSDAVAAIKSKPLEIAEFLSAFFDMDYPEFYSGDGEERVMKYHIAWSIAYFLQVGAPEVRFQPFRNLRSDLLKELVRTRRRDEAVKSALSGEMQRELIAEWLSFWKKY